MKDLVLGEIKRKAHSLYDYQDEIEIAPIPFKGEWGFSTTIAFKIAGRQKKDFRKALKEVSETIASHLECR
jgi:hypothetical protein